MDSLMNEPALKVECTRYKVAFQSQMTTPFSSKITTLPAKMDSTKSPTIRSRKISVGNPIEIPTLALSTDTAEVPPVVQAPLPPEPLLSNAEDRLVLFPIRYPDIWSRCKHQQSIIWLAEEIDLSKDMKDWEKLLTDEQYFVKNILGFFAGSDGLVMENLATRFSKDVMVPEARYFYANQTYMEAVHSETYSLLIDTYVTDKEEKIKILHAIDTIPCVKKKAEWAQEWIDSTDADFATRLIGFAAVEGIFFSGSFCAIFWLKERGLLPGLTTSNEFIARDEGMHMEFACLLYSKLVTRVPKAKVHKLIREAVKIEKNFITKSLPCELIGMNAKLMAQYIEFVADRLCLMLGYPKIYCSANPFSFMERLSMENKDNFFEKRVSTYAKAAVGKSKEDMSFKMTEDF
jgi:ribonucleotide reductase beta subunit family protein with ferritin-like domain